MTFNIRMIKKNHTCCLMMNCQITFQLNDKLNFQFNDKLNFQILFHILSYYSLSIFNHIQFVLIKLKH